MTPARILIVEDDRIVARDIRLHLGRMGHTVVGVTGSGEEAVQLASAVRPDLVLMDIRLEGEMDGIEAARRIRTTRRVPVVFLTAYANDDTVRRASLSDPFGYLLKPFEEPQMRAAIQMALYKHEAEAKLRLGERRFEAAIASIGDGVITTNQSAQIEYMNPVAETLTRWSFQDAVGQPLCDVYVVVDEVTREPLSALAKEVLTSGTSEPTRAGALLIARDGTEVPVEDRCSPIVDEPGGVEGAVLVFGTVAERRAAAEALQQAQSDLAHVGRLTLMGELAAAIAHEVNQPLMAIVTNAGTCLEWMAREQPDLAKARAAVERIVRDGERAARVVRSIHALAQRSPNAFTLLTLPDVVTDTMVLIPGEIRRAGTRVVVQLEEDPPLVRGDRVQLQQVLLNLIVNALEAMGQIPEADRVLTVRATSGSTTGCLEVEDTGLGVPDDLRERIFDALFTTKGNGMGMGLAISRSIALLHQGSLCALPAAGGGTLFRLTLPLDPDEGRR